MPLTLVLAIGVAGCGGGGSSSSTPTSTATAAKTPAATRTAATSSGPVAQGKALYASKGCQACHSIDGSKRTGPTWKGLAGSQVKLTDGQTVKADAKYLVTSIENPDKQIVAGYQPGVMSSSIQKGSVPAGDAAKLVAYIESLR